MFRRFVPTTQYLLKQFGNLTSNNTLSSGLKAIHFPASAYPQLPKQSPMPMLQSNSKSSSDINITSSENGISIRFPSAALARAYAEHDSVNLKANKDGSIFIPMKTESEIAAATILKNLFHQDLDYQAEAALEEHIQKIKDDNLEAQQISELRAKIEETDQEFQPLSKLVF